MTSSFRWTAAAVLGVVGLLLNLLAVQLSPGTDLIFGGVAYLLAAAALGPLAGGVAAAIASARTLWLWNHPYAWLIFTAEGVVVGWAVRRWRLRPLVADLLYWIAVGLPLYLLTYVLLLDFGGYNASAVFLKQALNGLIDALLVEALLLVPAVRFLLRVPIAPGIRSALATVMALAATLPTLGFGVWEGRKEWADGVERAEERARLGARAYTARIEQYVLLHERAVRTIAETAERRGTWSPEQLQRLLDSEREVFPGFVNLYAADANARTVAFSPTVSASGQSLIGLDFSDRDYFRRLRATRETVVSDVFAGRGGVAAPLVVIAHPVLLRDSMAGYVLGALDLRAFPEPTELIGQQLLRVADARGSVISGPDRAYGAPGRPVSLADSAAFDAVRAAGAGGIATYLAGGTTATAVATATAARVLAGVDQVPSLGWWVWVEQPFGDIQRAVTSTYVRLFLLLIGLILLALLLSVWLAGWMARPLLRLQAAVTSLGAGNLLARVGPLPAGVPAEVEELARGFDEMAETTAVREREMRELTEAAQAASQAKSDFIATMSHELRTPLNAIGGHLELVEMGIHGELTQAQRTAIGRVQIAARHLRGLIEEVLSFSRLEADRVEVQLQRVDVCEVMHEVGAVIEPLAAEKGLRFRIQCDVGATLHTDPDKVRQVLINLAGNAVKFTERGEVELGAEPGDDAVALFVRDTGPGIAPEDRQRLFRPFEQLHGGLARPHGGTGLGLYLSGRYAQLLGGRIEVESELERGSTFKLILPRDGEGEREVGGGGWG